MYSYNISTFAQDQKYNIHVPPGSIVGTCHTDHETQFTVPLFKTTHPGEEWIQVDSDRPPFQETSHKAHLEHLTRVAALRVCSQRNHGDQYLDATDLGLFDNAGWQLLVGKIIFRVQRTGKGFCHTDMR